MCIVVYYQVVKYGTPLVVVCSSIISLIINEYCESYSSSILINCSSIIYLFLRTIDSVIKKGFLITAS